MCKINRKNKDRLFCFIYGREENKAWTLELFNAINNSTFSNVNDIQIETIENVIYMGMKNDVAFLVQDILSSYEQQSKFNPNMPVRQLMYISKLYNKYIHKNKLNVYSENIVHLPKPKFVVFYNGVKDEEDRVLKLSDAFNNNDGFESDIAVNVRMININYGRNKELMAKCKSLEEYSWFIEQIRLNSKTMDILEAVNKSLSDMPDSFEIKSFLMNNKAEVTDMCITEYNEEETLAAIGKEKFEEGRAEGKAEGKAESINKIKIMIENGKLDEDTARMIIANLSEE